MDFTVLFIHVYNKIFITLMNIYHDLDVGKRGREKRGNLKDILPQIFN